MRGKGQLHCTTEYSVWSTNHEPSVNFDARIKKLFCLIPSGKKSTQIFTYENLLFCTFDFFAEHSDPKL